MSIQEPKIPPSNPGELYNSLCTLQEGVIFLLFFIAFHGYHLLLNALSAISYRLGNSAQPSSHSQGGGHMDTEHNPQSLYYPGPRRGLTLHGTVDNVD